ncbi:aromatic prenyltransferase [Streptomyces sp. NPDC018029]|uniref:Putative prenyltransferase n=1 Tax=Streptomyces virginiae TaxID=1961 RepID=A2AXG7_STRVG|nr:putative prenyltransferase [Streptomyces virginiae]
MSPVTGTEEVYAAVAAAARLAGVPCTREKVHPVLSAYGEGLERAGVVYSVSTSHSTPTELDYTVTVPAAGEDPYATAVRHGFVTPDGHPVHTLLSHLQSRCEISEYLVDGGVVGGFNKIYAHFPQDVQKISRLAELPGMPPALARCAALLERHGLSDVAMIGIDYPRRTLNLYFTQLSEECRAPQTILSLHREIGLPAPGQPMLDFARRSFRIYTTLSWDSAGIERICYAPPPARGWDPAALPAEITEQVRGFVDGAPRAYEGEPIVIAAVKWAPEGPYLNLGPYYQLSPLMRKVISAVHNKEI